MVSIILEHLMKGHPLRDSTSSSVTTAVRTIIDGRAKMSHLWAYISLTFKLRRETDVAKV